MPKVLYVSHSHPANVPGGAEMYAYELYLAVRDGGEFEPTLVARAGPPQTTDPPHAGTRLALADGDDHQYFFYTEREELDWLTLTARDKRLYTKDWRDCLRAIKPDVVHFQHTLWLGYDIVRETHNALPDVPIVYTLHEFVPICMHGGQMVRTSTFELCEEASPRRCRQCFPQHPMGTFFLRERFMKSTFEVVDLFIAPSEHLRRMYLKWGIPPQKIRYEDYGRIPVQRAADPPRAGRRRRIGYFGQFTMTKGVDVLLEAMKILQRDGDEVQLLLRGANLEFRNPEFQQRIRSLLAETAECVRFTGRYEHAELPGLMSAVDWVIVPSIWWENSPLVIQEAMMHRRPVICSDIGGMAEKVREGVNGLHFRVRDRHSLAETIRRAVNDPELWDSIHATITDPHPMADHVRTITAIYKELLSERRARPPRAPLALAVNS